MKTVKKLLSLMLVAVLLLSAVPFQASAANKIRVDVYMDGEYADYIMMDIDGLTTGAIWAEFASIPGTNADQAISRSVKLNGVSVSGELTVTASDKLELWVVYSDASSTTTTGTTQATQNTETTSATTGSMIETITRPTSATETTGAPTTPSEPSGGQGGSQEQSYTVIVDYTDGAEGEPARIYTMKAGDAYGSRLPANPQRNAMTFRYWVYRGTNTVVNAESLVDASKANANGEIYIDAVWNVQTLTLELIDIRGTDPAITKIKAVKVGQPIGELPTPTRAGYIFVGWKLNGNFINENTIWELGDSATAYAIWAQEGALPGQLVPEEDGAVYLEIYLNGDWNLAKRVDISAYVGKNDEVITRAEVETVVKKYFSPKSGYTLQFVGLFDEETWFNYTRDQETDGAPSIKITMLDGDIKKDHYIYVMVNNVKITQADPSNPKTGDAILGVVATMFISGGAALFLNEKKRKQF